MKHFPILFQHFPAFYDRHFNFQCTPLSFKYFSLTCFKNFYLFTNRFGACFLKIKHTKN